MGLKQFVEGTTHIHGHTLVISHVNNKVLLNRPVVHDFISDHAVIICEVNMGLKKSNFKKEVKFRKIKSINIPEFRQILSEKLQSMPNVEESDINVLVSHYFNSGRSVLDTLVPVVKTLLPVRERRPWFNDNLRENKKIKRKLEGKWRASRSHSDFKAFQRAKVNFNSLTSKTKEMFYTDFISKNINDQKLLFSMVHKLMDSKKEPEFPASSSTQRLANDFNDYFIEKVQSIRDEFLEDDMSVSTPHDGRAVPPFSKFTVLSLKTMMSFIQIVNHVS